MGVTLHAEADGGGASFRVWAPHVRAAAVEVNGGVRLPLQRDGDCWAARFAPGQLVAGAAYRVLLEGEDGQTLPPRRDPYARHTDFDSAWCYVDNAAAFDWRHPWEPLPFDEYLIYEMHVGSFTPEGTFAAAAARLGHVAGAGFTAVQLMPITEHSDAWGYNPRQLLAVHGAYGTPDELRSLVDTAHSLGLAVILDVVLHHGAPEGNELWEYDGWGPGYAHGGIYHEHAPDTTWGRNFAFWKTEVTDMLRDACASWLGDFRVDGLRFDSANDLPPQTVQALTWAMRERFPGRILTAEVTPENPMSVHELGFDSVWVHSGYFDIIQQHRALGRGHHGGGDWAEGWNLPRLRTVMGLHYGFTAPTQCIKYLLGSHDQVGCSKGGAWYEDYAYIGGQHRYAVDQYGGGRGDPHARASARLWYTANVAAAGLPMIFMGTEFAQSGWWNTDEWHRLQWEQAEDEIGRQMLALFRDANALRRQFPALRRGGVSILHEDRPNGVMAFDRTDGLERLVTVVNAGRSSFQGGEYGCWVGGGSFTEVFSSQDAAYGGWEGVRTNAGGVLHSHDSKLWINLPGQTTLVFKQEA
ncbi:hypothetical protein WJX81_004831 [Elliptochloris bilobata]|uniref:1,4-alpha-glucan branching enzyme n=1 Tax=Elliptochloris bilobata TaxID=381761 RepID=A0AAW1QMJ1_9CHLO